MTAPAATPKKRAPGARAPKPPLRSVAVGPDNQVTLKGATTNLLHNYQSLAYGMPWEALDAVEALATFNADYSQAVDNISTLANSGHELFVDAGTKGKTKELKSYLEGVARVVQEPSGGVDGLIDKMLHQAATFGAMCGEWVVDANTLQVVDFADINPKTIRFFWNEDASVWEPYQKVSAAQQEEAKDRGQKIKNGCIELNPVTFHYFSFNAAPNSPYGVPPFMAALEYIGIQRDMTANMSQIVKKLGLLGIVDITVEQLQPLPGETDESFASRANGFLDSYVDATENMVRDGGIVHFDDVTVESQQITGNAAGATNLFKQNEELIFSGLKSMPSVQGRSYSTTETYAGVAYDIIIRNTKRYQRACKRLIESGYWLAAQLAGYNPKSISVQFKENKTLHRLQDAQSEQIEIMNAAKLWLAGVIDQDGFAQTMGYNDVKTKLDEIPPELYGGTAPNQEADPENGDLNSDGGGKPDNANNSRPRNQGYVTDDNGEIL